MTMPYVNNNFSVPNTTVFPSSLSPDVPNTSRHQSNQRSNASNSMPRPDTQRSKDRGPIIAMAPPAAGLPIIQSVQSGVSVADNETNHFQLSNQITLSVKPKENANTNGQESNAAASNAVNILTNRGILIKPKTHNNNNNNYKSNDSSPPNVTLTPPKCGTAEEAVQKLQMNNSVSIISKKQASSRSLDDLPMIDLSNDEDNDSESSLRKSSGSGSVSGSGNARKTTLKCPVKTCDARFSGIVSLREHTRTEHRQSTRTISCSICFKECASSMELSRHHMREHQNSQLGIPIVDLRKPQTREKLLDMGIVSFIPIENYTRHEDTTGLAMPIISIQGTSSESLINLLGANDVSVMPLNKIRRLTKSVSTTTGPVGMTPARPMRSSEPIIGQSISNGDVTMRTI